MAKPPAAENVDHGRSHPRFSGSVRLPTYLLLMTIPTINLLYLTYCSPLCSPSLWLPPPRLPVHPSVPAARPPVAPLRRGPAQQDDGMGPLPAPGLAGPPPYGSSAVNRSCSALRLCLLSGTLVEMPCAADSLAVMFSEFCLGFRARLPPALPLPHLLPQLWKSSVRDEFLRLHRNRAAYSEFCVSCG